MNIFQRVALAGQIIFSGGFKSLATLVPSWQDGEPTYNPVKFESLVRHGYHKNELIYSCIDKTARAASQVKLDISMPDGQLISSQHPLQKLLDSPNPFMTQSDLWAAIVIFQKLAGRAIFEKERNNGGQVIALWPMRPDWVKVIPSSVDFIAGYSYEPPGLTPTVLSPEDVLDIKLFDPIHQYNGYPPVAVAARVGDVDNAQTDYLKMFFEKGGMPPVYIKTSKKVSDSILEATRQRWAARYGGSHHWTEPAILDSDFEVHKTGMNFNEMEFEALDARDEVRICMVLNVPPLIAGAKVGLDRATYNNAPIMRQIWWEDILIPQFVDWSDAIQRSIVNEFDPRLEAEWNFGEVPALQEKVSEVWQRGMDGISKGVMTVNEFREMIGLPPDKQGDIYLRPGLMVPVPAEFDLKELKRSRREMRTFAVNGKITKQREPPDNDERLKNEERLRKVMRKYLREQKDRVLQELKDAV